MAAVNPAKNLPVVIAVVVSTAVGSCLLAWSFIDTSSYFTAAASEETQKNPGLPDLTDPPQGWIAYPQPSDDELRCANYSDSEWRLTLDNGQLQIRLDKAADHRDPLPPEIRSRSVAVGSKGDRHVIRVNDGWLVGLDVGEFGGGLWWFSADGKHNRKLSDENVVGFSSTANGVLVLVGLAHLGFDSGKVLRLTGADRRLQPLVNLRSAPVAFALESPETLLVLTTNALVRVRMVGKVETLYKTKYGLLYPNSMSVSSSGVIHVGMRHFITRLTPLGNSFKEEWFVPATCKNFAIRDVDCVCSSDH